MNVRGFVAQIPATPYATEWDDEFYLQAPAINHNGDALRREFESDVRIERLKRSHGTARSRRSLAHCLLASEPTYAI